MSNTLLIIGFVWPEPKSSAAGSRMLQLIEIFQLADYKITFASACAKTNNAFNLESIGVTQVSIKLNHSSFDDFVKQLNPKVVMFDRFMTEEQFGWRVTEQCPNALKILDTEDLHCLRKGRHQAFKEGALFNKTYLFNTIAKREIASIYRCDLTIMISEAEIHILKTDFKVDEALLCYLPFLLNRIPENDITQLKPFAERAHFITIGNFLHAPNYNGVLHLKQNIWPLIKKQLPKAEMHIYGAYASEKVNQLHNDKNGFLIKGFAPYVNTVMQQARVCLAPLQFGAGLKGKLVDAMQNGTPCVSTHVGAEGMFGNLAPNGFIENSVDKFAQKAVELYKNEALWKEKQQNGFKIVNNRFDKKHFQTTCIEKIDFLLQNLQSHRFENFTGQMLQHHALQSTKFMSKWIEAKNN